MESLTSGTMAGTGSFRCENCGYVVTLAATEQLGACPSCGQNNYARASLFAAGRFQRRAASGLDEHEELMRRARELADAEVAAHVAFLDGEELRVVSLTAETTRIGRTLTADIRFDDPTVSRRHALLVQRADGLHVLDDRSLNGVFVNDERVSARLLQHGDELVIGRHRLLVLVNAEAAGTLADAGLSGSSAA
jgi:predicted  nucleic acid-binding Zn-ribbon protein